MTKKDFEVIAIALKRSRPPETDIGPEWDQWLLTRRIFMGLLALANPRFDAAKFRAATER